MIVGIGVDVVDIERFGRQLERTPGLRDRLFVPAERELNTRSLAARFAAKEAVAFCDFKRTGFPQRCARSNREIHRPNIDDPLSNG